jgi:hypothetical protein
MINPKHETLNIKQTQNTKPKIKNRGFVYNFEFKLLGLFSVSNLVFRIYHITDVFHRFIEGVS